MDIPEAASGSADLKVGQEFSGMIKLDLNGIAPDNIGLEMVMVRGSEKDFQKEIVETEELKCIHCEESVAEYEIVKHAAQSGQFDIGFRIFPKMEDLPHRMDLPLVRWI